MPLDGDMAGGIVPAEDVKPILKDPFGVSVLTEHSGASLFSTCAPKIILLFCSKFIYF
jgi:hypothetical protein